MITLDALAAARAAGAPRPDRPATSILHDSPDARVVVFRIAPGQEVAPHTSTSTVVLTVIAGTGIVSGGAGEAAVAPGTVVAYAPEELHGMRAAPDAEGPLVLVACITPRPGARHTSVPLARAG